MNLKNKTLFLAIFGLLIINIACQAPNTAEVPENTPKPQQAQLAKTQSKQAIQTPKAEPIVTNENTVTELKNVSPAESTQNKETDKPIPVTESKDATKQQEKQQEIQEQKPAETPKTEVKTEQKIPSQPQVQETKKVEQAATNLKKQQPKAEQPKPVQPKVQQPKVQQPKKQQPKKQQIKTLQTKTEQPKKQQVKTQQVSTPQQKKVALQQNSGVPPKQQIDVRAPNPNMPGKENRTSDPLMEPMYNPNISGLPEFKFANKPLLNQTQSQQNTPFYCGRKIFKRVAPTKNNTKFPFMPGMNGMKGPNTKEIAEKDRQTLIQTSYGFSLYLDAFDVYTTKMLQITGKIEAQLLNLLGHLLKQGNKVLIVGPQEGVVPVAVGKMVGPTGKLYILEPYAMSHKLITKNIQYNKLQSITTIYKIGAYNEKTTGAVVGRPSSPAPFLQFRQGPTSQIKKIGNNQPIQTTTKDRKVSPFRPTRPFQTLDPNQQISTDQIDNILPKDVTIDFAIIKAERMQIKALFGMRKLIQRSPNLVLIIEWWSQARTKQDKQQTKALMKQLQDKEYKAYLYGMGNLIKCQLGQFKEIQKLDETLQLVKTLIYFFPKTVPLPK